MTNSLLTNQKTLHFYSSYVGITDETTLEKHLNNVQFLLSKNSYVYKCIREFKFAYSRMTSRFFYPRVIEMSKISPTPIFIDIGCCTGIDLRELMLSGYPAHALLGTDISSHYIECGYTLCRDKNTLPIQFLVGDIFDTNFLSPDGEEGLSVYRQRAGIVYAGSIVHLFDSVEHISRFLQSVIILLQPGGLFIGAHVGSNCTVSVHRQLKNRTKHYFSIDTFRHLLETHGFTSIEIRTDLRPAIENDEALKDMDIFWIYYSAVYSPYPL
ncbi:S-adenosyl-L-methionine-dependent methyltransferase [Spinellus fusiger]|nr:S-adenosyl-L-methionine-dependent methyltransferase [Spinellus fusiger]